MTELEQARHIEAGDAYQAEQFVRDHYLAVFRLLFRLTGRREEAEDLTQQTFVIGRQNIGSFRGRSSLRTWLHRIAFNEYKQWRRRHRRTEPIRIEQSSRDRGIEAFEQGHMLLEALNQLSDKLREAFLLHEVEQLSVQEVSQVVGIPLGTAKARVFYARQQLRGLLEERTSTHKNPIIEVTPDAIQES